MNDRFEAVPLVVFFSKSDGTAVAWKRSANGRELTFEASERAGPAGGRRDRETGTWWSWLTGEAVEGALKGARLASVSHNPILVERFRAFYPDGPVFEQPRPSSSGR